MYSVELYNRVRRACHVDGMSKSEAARVFGIDRKTVTKILKHSVPPGYRRVRPPARPKLDPFIPIIDQILEDDKGRLKKQRHTAKRIHQRLRDEHRFTGGIMSTAPCARHSTSGRSATTRSSTWCCVASRGARRDSIWTSTPTCPGPGSGP
jgi:hypothetical protein